MSEQLLHQIINQLDGLNGRFDKFERVTNERFDKLESRFDKLESRFDKLELRFDTLASRIDSLEMRFDTMESRFDKFESETSARFTTIEAKLDSIKAQAAVNSAYATSIKELAATVAMHTTDIALLKKLAAS